MPKIPVYSQVPTAQPTIQLGTPRVATPIQPNVPEGAFGGDSANAAARLGQTFAAAGNDFAKIVLAQKEQDNKQQVLDAHTDYMRAMQEILHSPDLIDDKTPRGYLNRQLGQARGATVSFDSQAELLQQRYIQNLQTPQQQEAFKEMSNRTYLSARDSVISHEAAQRRNDLKNSFEANAKMRVESAPSIKTAKELAAFMDETRTIADGFLKGTGADEATSQKTGDDLNAAILKSKIMSVLDTKPKVAQAYLDALKAKVSPEVAADLQKSIDGKLIFDKMVDTSAKSRANARRPDGTFDEEVIKKNIMKLNMPTEEKLKVLNFAQSDASNFNRNVMTTRTANERGMENNIVKSIQGGTPLTAVHDMINKSGGLDAVSKTQLTEFANKIAAGPTLHSDPATFNGIHDALMFGNLSPDQIRDYRPKIDAALKANLLTVKDHQTLVDKMLGALKQDNNQVLEVTLRNIENIAKGDLADSTALGNYMYVVKTIAHDENIHDPVELQKRADQLLKQQVEQTKAGNWFYESTNTKETVPTWKHVFREKQMQTLMGPDVYKALGGDPSKVQEFVNNMGRGRFGGSSGEREPFKIGRPANNAVKSLQKYGLQITPETIKQVLEKTGGTGIAE